MTTPSSSAPVLPTPALEELESLNATALKARLHRRVEDAFQLCREVHPALPRPTVWLDLRGKSAGQAHFGRGGLRFNAQLYAENRQAFLVEVVPHEMAHWLVWHLEDGASAAPPWPRVADRNAAAVRARAQHHPSLRCDPGEPCPLIAMLWLSGALLQPASAPPATQGQAYRCRQCAQTLVYQCGRAGIRERPSKPLLCKKKFVYQCLKGAAASRGICWTSFPGRRR